MENMVSLQKVFTEANDFIMSQAKAASNEVAGEEATSEETSKE